MRLRRWRRRHLRIEEIVRGDYGRFLHLAFVAKVCNKECEEEVAYTGSKKDRQDQA